jgi:hypothetical protein
MTSSRINTSHISDLIIQGVDDQVSIEYLEFDLSFMSNIALVNIHWIGSAQSSVYLTNSTNISIINCSFATSNLVIENNNGNITIDGCTFKQPTAVNRALLNVNITDQRFSGSMYTLKNCLFHGDHSNLLPINTHKFANGSLSFTVGPLVNDITLRMESNNFIGNTGEYGGGTHICINSQTTGNKVFINDCLYVGNKAKLGGGLLFKVIDNEPVNQSNKLDLVFLIDSCNFLDNIGYHAGGMAIQTTLSYNSVAGLNITLLNTSFIENVAYEAGAALAAFNWGADQTDKIPIWLTLIDSRIIGNYINIFKYQLDHNKEMTFGSGAIYMQSMSIGFAGETLICNNLGTAILASSASIYMAGNVIMQGNHGIKGGAANLVGSAKFVVQNGLNLTIKNNTALVYGGAVYHVFPIIGVAGQNEYCTFVYYDRTVDPNDWNASLSFIDNEAAREGQSFYISSLDSCVENNNGRIFFENSTFNFMPNYERQIVTPPVNIIFNSNHKSFNCNESICEIDAMLGEQIVISNKAVDKFGQTIKSFAAVTVAHQTGHNYTLGGVSLTELSEEISKVPFFIKGADVEDIGDHLTVKIRWQTIDEPSAVAYLNVNIRKCYLGYVYDSAQEICTCYDKSDDEFYCDRNTYTACLQTGYWYGNICVNDTSKYAVASCPFGYCNYTVTGNCPTKPCGPDGSEYQFYCQLPKYNSDELCLFNRGGTLCSQCSANHSFSFDAIRCVPINYCSDYYIALNILLCLLFWALIISIIFVVAKLNLRIGSGQLYCLVFYFSVLQYFVKGQFPSYFLYVLELIVTGFIQLDPKMFGMIESCTLYEINHSSINLLYATIHFINPFFLIGVIGLMIYVSWKWSRLTLFRDTNIGVNMICITMYIAFMSLSQTSLDILTPVHYPGINATFVAIEPNMRYFDPLGHLPFALISIMVQLFLVIPFLVLLIFAPYFIRIKKLNLTRLKPILDEYQNCYKESYRSFAGFYLTCRQFIFFINLLSLTATNNIYILQALSILILTIHCLFQPYKSSLLNVLDGLLILNLVFLSILHGNTANFVFDEILPLKSALIHILVLLPMLYMFLICLVVSCKQVKRFTPLFNKYDNFISRFKAKH